MQHHIKLSSYFYISAISIYYLVRVSLIIQVTYYKPINTDSIGLDSHLLIVTLLP